MIAEIVIRLYTEHLVGLIIGLGAAAVCARFDRYRRDKEDRS